MKKGTLVKYRFAKCSEDALLLCTETSDRHDYWLKFAEYNDDKKKCERPVSLPYDANFEIVRHLNPRELRN